MQTKTFVFHKNESTGILFLFLIIDTESYLIVFWCDRFPDAKLLHTLKVDAATMECPVNDDLSAYIHYLSTSKIGKFFG